MAEPLRITLPNQWYEPRDKPRILFRRKQQEIIPYFSSAEGGLKTLLRISVSFYLLYRKFYRSGNYAPSILQVNQPRRIELRR